MTEQPMLTLLGDQGGSCAGDACIRPEAPGAERAREALLPWPLAGDGDQAGTRSPAAR